VTDWRDAYRGAVMPLHGTPRTPSRATLGPGVTDMSRRMGKPLRLWQQYVADVALEVEPDTGLLAYDTVVLVAMRQQGKSELMLPVIAHRAIAFPSVSARYFGRVDRAGKPVPDPLHDGQQILYTAQTADMARLRWRRNHLVRMLAAPTVRQHMANPADQYGGAVVSKQAEAAFFKNGSVYAPGATTGKTAGTGETLDVPFVDEAWSHESSRALLGLRPAMLTRTFGQTWILSMVPGPSRLEGDRSWRFLKDLIAVGKAQVAAGVNAGTAFFLYGAPDGVDPGDPAVWRSYMPNLGAGISEAAVASDFALFALGDFEAEYLSIEAGTRRVQWATISERVWSGLEDSLSSVQGRPAFGVELSEDRRRAWVGAAGRREDGHRHVEIVEPGFAVPADQVGVDWVESCVIDMAVAQDASAIVLDPRRPAGSLKPGLERRLREAKRDKRTKVLTPSIQDIAGGCGRFYDRTGQEMSTEDTGVRLRHIGQQELDDGIAELRKLDMGGGSFTFVKKGSLFGLGPVYSVILAMHGDDVCGSLNRKPAVF
jgi:hypothetical protein